MGEPGWLRAIRKSKGGARLIARHQRPRGPGEGERLGDIHRDEDSFRLDVPQPLVYVCDRRRGLYSWWCCDPDGRWLYVPLDAVQIDSEGRITAYQGQAFANPLVGGVGWQGTLIQGVWDPPEGAKHGSEEDEEAVAG